MDIPQTMMNFYEEPEAMKELINYLADWEVEYADVVCAKLHPDAVFHHDDWGTQRSTFISPQMFEEFLLPAYKRIYKSCLLYTSNGDFPGAGIQDGEEDPGEAEEKFNVKGSSQVYFNNEVIILTPIIKSGSEKDD